jgi:hypothetical protein
MDITENVIVKCRKCQGSGIVDITDTYINNHFVSITGNWNKYCGCEIGKKKKIDNESFTCGCLIQ